MSRRACLLTRDDVPQYIREIVKRLHPVLMEYEDEEGKWWDEQVPTTHDYEWKVTRSHKRKALREGWRNHAYLVISDTVAHRFEKDGFYRQS